MDMLQSELISLFPPENSIANRVLLISPSDFVKLAGASISECRVFLLVTSGQLKVCVDKSDLVIKSDSFVDILVWEPITFIEMSDDLNAWCLLPNYKFTNESLNGLKPADSESFKDRYAFPLLTLEPNETGILEKQLTLLFEALRGTTHFYRTELCQAYFKSFMLESGNIVHNRRLNLEATESVEKRQDVILRNFLKLVWKYFIKEHNVSFYAERLCLSSKHLSRVVRNLLGKTPYAVIRDELLQRATYLLVETQTPVQDVSRELNFTETAAFCKFFKKHTGMTPSAYRQTRRHENGSF